MKKLSILSLLGLTAFVAMPIYAQDVEEDINVNDDEIVAAVDDADVVAEDAVYEFAEVPDYGVDEEGFALEAINEDTIEGIVDADIENINDIFENEEVKAALDEAGLTSEEAAGLIGGVLGLFAGLGIAAWIVCIAWGILTIVAMWKVFTKAGEAGWKAIIPVYNVYIMYKIVGMKNWFWYSLLVPVCLGIIAGFIPESAENVASIITLIGGLFSGIVTIVVNYKLPRKFGWGVFTSILYVLFTAICVLILGFGSSKYQGKGKSETVVEA